MRGRETRRRLTTVLFTDIVGSTRTAAELGDERWRRLKVRHHALVRDELRRSRGHEVDTAGDGFLATFEEPTDAVRCAWAISGRLREIGLGIRAGVHTGGVEVSDAGVGGIAVHIAARIMTLADGEEILVSATVRDLVAGSGVELEDRGEHDLKGVPGRWRALAVSSVVGERRPAPLDQETATALRSEASEPPAPRRRRAPLALLAGVGAVVAAAVIILLLMRSEEGQSARPPAANPGGVLLEIDPDTGAQLNRWPISEPPPLNAPADLAVAADTVWLIRGLGTLTTSFIEGGNSIVGVDPDTGKVSANTQVQDQLGTQRVIEGARALWVLGLEGGGAGARVAQVDPATGDVLKQVALGGRQGSGGGPRGFEFPAGISIDEHAVWVVGLDGDLVRIDPLHGGIEDTGEVASSARDVVAGEGRVWVIDELQESLIPVDPQTLEPGKPVALSVSPKFMALGDGRIWVVDATAGSVQSVDVRTRDADTPIRVGAEPSDMVVSFGSVWVTNEGDGTISKIDPITGHVEELALNGLSPGAIVADEDRGTLWVWAR